MTAPESQGRFKVTIYCLCGASMVGSGAGDLDAVTDLQAAFWSVHDGEGHGPATAKQAANARRRQERADYREAEAMRRA